MSFESREDGRVYIVPMETLFDGFGWKVTMEEASLPNGKKKKTARVHRADTVTMIAEIRPGTILLLREYRPYYGEYLWMLPSGRIDKETDMTIAAQRELQEETGYRAATLKHLWTANVSESLVLTNHFFYASDLTPDPLPQDDDELMEVHEYSVEEALTLIESSPKVHLPSAYALRRYRGEKK
jgi:ADP-ribose pyrophosphatase